jgi:hypothetical protein
MIRRAISMSAMVVASAVSQETGPAKAALEQRLGEVKQSIAQNQARLRQYTWTETTEVSLKGEVKKREQNSCKYGPDGKVQKTPIGAAPPSEPSGRKGKIKARVVEKKVDELKDYMDRVGSLLHRYIPPDAQSMQAAFQAGRATLTPGAGVLAFSDYAKPGDEVKLTFDPATKKLVSYAVATYLDEPKDTVTMIARFSSLPDGTNFLEESVLDAAAKQIRIKTTNFEYHLAGG